jgi:hypothetical protein|tara:strand:- start:5190 stop:5408 length:219 start_codon:yes stop_codon:yes gene_type:complete
MSKNKLQIGQRFLEAEKEKLRAEIENARAKIELYVSNPLAVADHSEIGEEIRKAAAQGSQARDLLLFLEKSS